MRLTKEEEEKLKKEDLLKMIRKKELEEQRKERKKKIERNTSLKLNREEMIIKVCQIIHSHIESAEKYIKNPTQGAMLFHEDNFRR